MSLTESFFRNSFWGYEATQDVTLRRLSDTHTTSGDAATTTHSPERQSRFSVSSDEGYPVSPRSFNNMIRSPLSQRSRRSSRRDKSLPPVPRAYSLARHHRRHMTVRCSGLRAIDEISWPLPPGTKPPPRDSGGSGYLASKMSRARAGLFISTICAAHLCAYAGIGQTLAVLREISTSFGISNTSDLTWALAGYGLAISTFTLIAGRLGDTYGYKRILLAGFVWSAIWSAISGTAVYSTHIFFIFSRVFDGMGAALSIPNSLALLGATYSPGKQKAMVFTLVATMAPMGILVGAVSASLFALVWWPLTYWVSAVALLIIAGVGHFTIPDDSTSKGETPATIRNAIPELDIPGAISGVSALVLISFAWNQAPLVGWQEPYLWITLVVGMLIALLFLLIEIYYAHKPLIPFNAISFDVSFILVADACGWSCFGIWASYTWQFVKNIRGTPPLLATAYISPCIIVGCLATASTGFILQRLSTSIVVFISLLGFMLGSVLVATMPAVQTYWTQLFFSVLTVSWAMDTGFPATILALSNAFEKKHQSTAASLAYTVTYYSVFLGLGIARTVEAYVTRGDQSIDSKLKGYRVAVSTAISLAGLGILGCSAFFLKNLWRKKMCCKYHKEQELHQI